MAMRPPPPPLMAPQHSECAWLPVLLTDSLVWDDSAELLPSALQPLQKLVEDAQQRPLAPPQLKRLLAALVREGGDATCCIR